MSLHTNNSLPPEILKQVFKNLTFEKEGSISKKNIRACSLVCKLWQFVAQDFFNPEISINLEEKSLWPLLMNIPFFGNKVKSITLRRNQSFFSDEERKDASFDFLDIFLMCPNLVSVKFEMEDASDYLRALIFNQKRRNNSADRFHNYNTPIAELNPACHTKITSLTIEFSEKLTIKHFIYLKQIVTCFPNLTSFPLYVNVANGTMDIHELVKALPQLTELKLIMKEININSMHKEVLENSRLVKLHIVTKVMDIRSLEYIMKRLNQAKYLFLAILELTSEVSLSTDEKTQLFNELKNISAEMEGSWISYSYGNPPCYYLKDGKERSSFHDMSYERWMF